MGKTAIIIGATGLSGSILMQKLLADDRYDVIKAFVRKPTGIAHTKLVEKIGDVLHLEQFKGDFTGDEVYCCIGTTAKKTPDKTLYRQIDYGIPVSAAVLCIENNIGTLLVISALGADTSSRVFYNKTKGEMEQAVLNIPLAKIHILRPSIITGNRGENRIGEKLGIVFMKLFRPLFVGKLKKYRTISAETIAQAMINLANSDDKESILESDSIQEKGKAI